MFLKSLNFNADRTLFDCDDGTIYKYADALELSSSLGMQETSRQLVFCLCANVPGSLLGYLSLMAANAVPVMLSASIANDQLKNLLEVYRPAFIFLPQERVDEFAGVEIILQYYDHSLLSFDIATRDSLHKDLALLVSTSGSTGSPKMVRLSHKNIESNAVAISTYLELNCDEIPVTTLPPNYTFGFSVLNSHIINGCRIALTNRTFFDRRFWDFLKSARVSSLSGVPYHFEMLRKLRFSEMELPSLRTLTQAGGRLNPELIQEYASLCSRRGMRFFAMYGQAEASPRMAYLSPEKVFLKPCSIGRAIPGGEFWLEDELGYRIVDEDESGELIYQGNNVCMGYSDTRQDLAKGDELGGILKTGDVARRDADGDFYIVGRRKRFIKLFGHRVNLQEIESNLQALCHGLACSGQDDQLDVYICNGSAETAKVIKLQLINLLRVPPSTIRILKVVELPRSEVGKIKYAELPQLVTEKLA